MSVRNGVLATEDLVTRQGERFSALTEEATVDSSAKPPFVPLTVIVYQRSDESDIDNGRLRFARTAGVCWPFVVESGRPVSRGRRNELSPSLRIGFGLQFTLCLTPGRPERDCDDDTVEQPDSEGHNFSR